MPSTTIERNGVSVSTEETGAIQHHLCEGDLVAAEVRFTEVANRAHTLRDIITNEKTPQAANELRALSDFEQALQTLSMEIDVAKEQARRK